MTKRNKIKKFFAFLCVLVCLSSCFVFPASAAEDEIVLFTLVEPSGTKMWFPANDTYTSVTGQTVVNWENSSVYTISQLDPNTWRFDIPSDYLLDREEHGVSSHGWSGMLFDVSIYTDCTGINLADYDLRFTYRVDLSNGGENVSYNSQESIEKYFSSFDPSMGLTDTELATVGGKVPRIGSREMADIVMGDGYFEGECLIENTADIESIINNGTTLGIPIDLWNSPYTCVLISGMTLIYNGSSETPDSTTSPDDTTTPDDGDGYTQEDIDKAYNDGYNKGAEDYSDKNYVFGFVNGTFSGLSNFYSILADGISIGGITLGNIITSIIIIAVLAIIIKKVI